MAIFLVQHGISNLKEVDPERGLSDEGARITKRIGETARKQSIHISSIRHSGKKRALETAEIFAGLFGLQDKVFQVSGLAPFDDVPAMAGELNSDENVMIIGHLPFLEKLTSFMVTGSTEYKVVEFQNSGIICLDKTSGSKFWFIKWMLMPDI